MLNFGLCDDNIQILERLEKMLSSIFLKNDISAQICFKAKSAEEFLNYVDSTSVDVLILDINLKSHMSGCDIADAIRKKNKDAYIIFLTGHLEYVLLAYKYKTFDYLPKPITEEKLEETILRLVEDTKEVHSRFLKINNNTVIKQEEINYIKKDGMKLIFCTGTGNYETYSSFTQIEPSLPSNFVRCHKSYIANTDTIQNISTNNNKIIFTNDLSCDIGPKYKINLMEVFKHGNISNNLDSINNGE